MTFYCFGFNEMCQGITPYARTNHARFSSLSWSKTEPDCWCWIPLSSFSPKAFPGIQKSVIGLQKYTHDSEISSLLCFTGRPALAFVLGPNCEWHFITSGSMRCAKVLPRTREPIMLASQVYLEVKRSQTAGVEFFWVLLVPRHFPVYINQYGHAEIHQGRLWCHILTW